MPTLTASELGFSNGSAKFLGWRAYRDWDNTWWATMPDGRAGWVALEDGGSRRLLLPPAAGRVGDRLERLVGNRAPLRVLG